MNKYESYFPILILITEPHGLESGACIAGVDYDKYIIANSPEQVPVGISFQILQTRFTGKSVVKPYP